MDPKEKIFVTVIKHLTGISITCKYTFRDILGCTISKVTCIIEEKACLLNKENVRDHRCERTKVATK